MKLQIRDIDGNILDEKELVLSDNDTLIMEFNQEKLNLDIAHKIFKMVSEKLEEKSEIIAVPDSITFKILKKQA